MLYLFVKLCGLHDGEATEETLNRTFVQQAFRVMRTNDSEQNYRRISTKNAKCDDEQTCCRGNVNAQQETRVVL